MRGAIARVRPIAPTGAGACRCGLQPERADPRFVCTPDDLGRAPRVWRNGWCQRPLKRTL